MAGFGRVSAHIISQLGPGSLTGTGAQTRKLEDDCSFRSEQGRSIKMTQTDIHLGAGNLGSQPEHEQFGGQG